MQPELLVRVTMTESAKAIEGTAQVLYSLLKPLARMLFLYTVACAAGMILSVGTVVQFIISNSVDGIHRRIDDTNHRIDDTNRSLEATNQRIDVTNQKLEGISQRLEETDRQVVDLNRRVQTLDTSIRSELSQMRSTIEQQSSVLQDRLAEQQRQMEARLSAKIEAQAANFREELRTAIESRAPGLSEGSRRVRTVALSAFGSNAEIEVPAEGPSVASLLLLSDRFSAFREALTADQISELDKEGPFIVLAPVDAAFPDFAADLKGGDAFHTTVFADAVKSRLTQQATAALRNCFPNLADGLATGGRLVPDATRVLAARNGIICRIDAPR